MKKLSILTAATLCMAFFYSHLLAASVMSADEFAKTVQALSQQTQQRLNDQIKQLLGSQGAPANPAQASPASATPAATTPAPYTGFGTTPPPATTPSTTTPPPATKENSPGWNGLYR